MSSSLMPRTANTSLKEGWMIKLCTAEFMIRTGLQTQEIWSLSLDFIQNDTRSVKF